MKINDTLAGFLCLIGAVVLWVNARGLPNPANQPVGPGAFPALIAVLLGMVALYLIWGGLRTSPRTPLMTLSDWTRQPLRVGRFLMIPLAVAFYVATVDVVGFIPLMLLILLTLLIACAVRPLPAIAIAVFVTFFVHTIFYVMLKVQLPWGLLEAVRW